MRGDDAAGGKVSAAASNEHSNLHWNPFVAHTRLHERRVITKLHS
jgi:hypothetical protein